MRPITSPLMVMGCAILFGSLGTTAELHAQPTTHPQPTVDRYGHLGIGTLTPDPSSMLDIQGTDGGFLIPRLTTAQQNAILQPAPSLILFNLTENAFHFNAGTSGTPNWIPLIDAASLGNILADEVWTTEGNSGTNPAQHFLGTTDAADFVIRTTDMERMRILAGGNIGIGTTTPTARLQVDETGGGAANALRSSTNGSGNAIDAVTTGSGRAGSFQVNNGAGTAFAVAVSSNGDNDALHVEHSGDLGNAGEFQTLNAANTNSTLDVATVGGGNAGNFVVNNGVSTASAVNAQTNGAGDALNGTNSGIGGNAGNLEITNPLNDANVLDAATVGTGAAGNFIVNNAASTANAVNTQTNGGGDALNATNSGTGGSAGSFQTTNAANLSTTLDVNTVGGGNAGHFTIDNSASTGIAVLAQTNGTANAVEALNSGTSGAAGLFRTTNTTNSTNTVDALTFGAGSAGSFAVNNAANSASALNARTDGTGHALNADNSGTAGSAGFFRTNNSVNNSATVNALTVGGGSAGDFAINNGASTAEAVEIETNGMGHALESVHSGTAGSAGSFETSNAANNSDVLEVSTVGGGSAGDFAINNAANGSDAVRSETNGTGNALYAANAGTAGSAGNFQITNPVNDNNVVNGSTVGGGSAGNFSINNATSSADAVNAQTNGTGDALNAVNSGTAGSAGDFAVTNAANNDNAVDATTQGGGSAGNFTVNNTGNSADAVNVSTNGTGDALNVVNSGAAGNAGAFSITDAANAGNTIEASTAGTGNTIEAQNTGTAGSVGLFDITDLSNTSTALDVGTMGEGSAGRFSIGNGQSPADALVVTTMGSGNAIGAGGDISPLTNAVYNLGNSLERWNRIYVDGLASIHIGTNGNEVDFGYDYNSNLMFYDFTGDLTPEVVMGDDGSLALGSNTLDPSAILSLNSTTKGLLLPRLTSTERNNIVNPATGLLVYNTTTNSYDFNFGTPGAPAWEGFVTTGSNSGWLTEGNTGLTDGTNNLFGTLDNTPIRFVTGSGGPHERMRIDAAGNIGIGTTAPIATVDVLGTNSDIVLTSVADNLNDSDIRLRRARGTVGAMTSILNGSYDVGTIRGQAYDGDEFVNTGFIKFSTDGNVGNNDMPGRIEFFTTPDGSVTPERRMIIMSDGLVGIGTSSPGKTLEVQDEDADIRVTSRHDSQISQLILRRARDNGGSEEPVQDGDDVAEIVGAGWDGSAYEGAARIRFTVDGNPSNGSDMPGRLEFFTTPDGSNSGLERMRIESDGHIGMGTSDPDVKLAIDGGLAIINSSASATTATTNLAVANRSYVQVSSNAAPASRAVTIANGAENGQVLVVQCTATGVNGVRLSDGGNINISTATYDMLEDDTITLIWDGDEWIETARSNN